ncbi:HelD family protein [Nostocoides australiense]|nr:AAA family ATPase [Tetrasphaera australiensis]HRW03241.1 AAA family ATPase [Tetrasphaera sp.]
MSTTPSTATTDVVAREIAHEQAHVDRVYAELGRASERAGLVAQDGLARGRTDRTGDIRDEEITGLFERDALMFHAARRQASLDQQYEGLVFGRLDLVDLGTRRVDPVDELPDEWWLDPDREVRYIGRLGVRDEEYEPLVIDWRAPAASAFYQATPVQPQGVIRRRVLRSSGPTVVGVEDDLMAPAAPDDIVITGDGALMAALTRTRGSRMRDIVATIQRHQDEAIRAPGRGVTEITGGPGTGKTVVALHRAAYLLYSERRRYEGGGVLVVGPSSAYTAYIERVLPSLGEESVLLRSLGDVVDAITTGRLDRPEVAAVKGTLRVRELLKRAARGRVPDAPDTFRAFVGGQAITLAPNVLDGIRRKVLNGHARNAATAAARGMLAEAAWATHRTGERGDFMEAFEESMAVDDFMESWWPQVDPREVLLWLADTDLAYRHGRGVFNDGELAAFAESIRDAIELGSWSVADVALIDDLSARLGLVQEADAEDRGFYEIDELDGRLGAEVRALGGPVSAADTPAAYRGDTRDALLRGRIGQPDEYAHILVDEAQDLSPMQWRMVGRRAEYASWTIVGDAAQAAWSDAAEAGRARDDAFGTQPRRTFHLDTNYRNAREIFDYARDVILPLVPDADIPNAVRETGSHPREAVLSLDTLTDVTAEVDRLAEDVAGSIAVISPARYAARLAPLDGAHDNRVVVIDPMSTKGLEWDATVVVDPDAIVDEAPGGIRILYVALTRAAHRMTVLRPVR